MPITYQVDATLGIVVARWCGPIPINEVVDYWTALAADKEALACGRAIADLRECELRFTGEELRLMAKQILEPALRGRNWKGAIVVKEPLQYGVSRQYGVYSEAFSNVNVFYSDVLARKWVLEAEPHANGLERRSARQGPSSPPVEK